MQIIVHQDIIKKGASQNAPLGCAENLLKDSFFGKDFLEGLSYNELLKLAKENGVNTSQ